MRYKLLIISTVFILIFNFSFSQITSRVLIEGRVSVPIGDSAEGVVVYNRSNNKGTITNEKGLFVIQAGIGDKIEVVAMQYQHFVVLIDKGIVQNKRVQIFLNESINKLEEVVVSPYDLLGNVKADVKKIGGEVGMLRKVETETARKINDSDYDFRPDALTNVENTVFLEDRMINGLNFVNLFKLIYKKANKPSEIKDVDYEIRNVYEDDFFQNYLALDIEKINDFILFAENNGLNGSYFRKGKELDLLQFLVFQSKLYKEQ